MRYGLVALLALSVASTVLAGPPKYKRGDKVEVEMGLETYQGEVVGIMRTGWVRVKFSDHSGRERILPFPPDRVDRATKEAKTAKGQTDATAPAEEQPGEPSTVPKGDWSQVQAVPMGDPGPWALKADPAPRLSLEPKAIALRSAKSSSKFRQARTVTALILNRVRREALVFSSNFGASLRGSGEMLVNRLDLAKGNASAPVALKTNGSVLDVDPSGERVAISVGMMGHRGSSAPRLEVWELGNTAGKLIAAWDPLDERAGNQFSPAPRFARFVDADHLLAVNWPSTLVLWEIPTRRVVYTLQLTGGQALALSPGGKYLAVGVANGIGLLDPLTGKTLGRLETDRFSQPQLSFQPDGKRLAAVSPGHVVVWDFEKGEQYRDFFFPTPTLQGRLDWVADGYLLVAGSKLIDLERRIVLWEYQLPSLFELDKSCGELGGVFWYTAGDGSHNGVVGVEIPHHEARRKAASLNADALLVLKPGAVVNLTVHIGGTPDEQLKARNDLTEQLKQLGIGVDPSSPLVLAATTETGKTKEQYYQEWGFSLGSPKIDKAKVTEQIARIRLTEGGNVLWESASVSGAPSLFYRRSDQTLQQAVDQMEPDNKYFFSQVLLPQYLARPGAGGAYGGSLLTDAGIRNVSMAELHRNVVPANALEPRVGRGTMRALGIDPPAPRGPGGRPNNPTGGL
jgi:hypothetical protein